MASDERQDEINLRSMPGSHHRGRKIKNDLEAQIIKQNQYLISIKITSTIIN